MGLFGWEVLAAEIEVKGGLFRGEIDEDKLKVISARPDRQSSSWRER